MSFENLKFSVVEDHRIQRRLLMRWPTELGAQESAGAPATIREPEPLDAVAADLSGPGTIRLRGSFTATLSAIRSSSFEPAVLPTESKD